MKKFSENPVDRITGRTIKSIEVMGDLSGKKILNVGSLGGWLEYELLKNNTFEKVVGFDLPGKFIKNLKSDNKNSKIDFLEGDITEELPFANNTFDIVCMWEVLEHLPKNKELFGLLEIDRVLKKGGKLFLSTPFFDWRSRYLDPVRYFGHRHYTEKQIKYLLKESGFMDFEVKVYGGYYELLGMLLFYPFKHFFRSEIPFKTFFEKKRKEEFEKKGFTNIFVEAIKINET